METVKPKATISPKTLLLIRRKALLILLFFTPFVIFPFEISPYEKPKVIFAQAIIEAITLLFLARRKTAFFEKPKSPFEYTLIIIFGLSIVHLVMNPTISTLFGNAIRLQGVFFLWHLLLLAYIASKTSLKIPALVPLFSLFSLLLAAVFMNANDTNRYVGTFGEPNSLAAAAIFIWPFVFIKNANRTLKIASLSLTVLLLFATKSESAYLAFFIQIIMLLPQVIPKIKQPIAFIAAAFVFIFGMTVPFIARSVTIDNRLLNQTTTFENRAEIWRISTEAGAKNPIIGHGFDHTLDAIHVYPNTFSKNQILDSSHNMFLDWWVQAGLIGFAAFIFLIIASLKLLAAKKMHAHLISFAGILTALSFNPASAASLIALWWLIGQGFRKN